MYTAFTTDFTVNELPQKEILRYMRAGADPSPEVINAVLEAQSRVLLAATCKGCYFREALEFLADDAVRIGEIKIKSSSLVNRLKGCTEAFVFAVTAGVGVDRAIRMAEAKGAVLSLACDAAGSALAEVLCDRLDAMLSDIVTLENRATVKRFSVGYGDLSLEYQRDIVTALNTSKNIGATLTDGVMMTPSKTVTAIVGIK